MICDYTVVRRACPNCRTIIEGHRDSEGRTRYRCPVCHLTQIQTRKGRRHSVIDEYIPEGYEIYGENEEKDW